MDSVSIPVQGDLPFDCLLIESTGIGGPLPVAATFDFRDEHGGSLSDVASLDTMVTGVDAAIPAPFSMAR
jgi:G3E family GTPase